jgi:hypothetical protein
MLITNNTDAIDADVPDRPSAWINVWMEKPRKVEMILVNVDSSTEDL